jgi:hypothetical protein
MIAKFQETFQLQERAKERNCKRVEGLLARVGALEAGGS